MALTAAPNSIKRSRRPRKDPATIASGEKK
jgi:hypothetical protein